MHSQWIRLACCLALGACAASSEQPVAEVAEQPALLPAESDVEEVASSQTVARSYSFVFLEAGEATELTQEQVAAASAGHRANIERLGDEGVLLFAGPFGVPRSDERLQGVFVFDEADPVRALQLTASDPAVQAGVFELRARRWTTDAPMRRVRELSNARKQAGVAFRPTVYVLGMCRSAAEAREALGGLAEEGLVMFQGELGPRADGSAGGELLFALDSDSVEEMEQWLRGLAPGLPWEFSVLYAGDELRQAAAEAR